MAIYAPARDVYAAARSWAESCLVGDGSLFENETLWTINNLDELQRCYVNHPDLSKRDFMTKFEEQLAGASASAKRLAAELIWPTLLFASNQGAATKTLKIRLVWHWAGTELPVDHPMLDPSVLKGVGSMGPGIQNNFWMEYAFCIEATTALKRKAEAERRATLSEGWAFASFLDSVDHSHGRQLYHTLAHLLFPEPFERIASRRHKRLIVDRFAVDGDAFDVRDRVSIDRELLVIRARLEADHGVGFDYYNDLELRQQWLPSSDENPGEDSDGPQTDHSPARLPDRYRDARFWAMGAGAGAHLWGDFKAQNVIAIGFEEFHGELIQLSKDDIFARIQAIRNDGSKPTMDALAGYQFASEMKKGDYVFAKQGRSTILGIGRITSGYRYDPSFPNYHHVRNVEWLKTGEWQLSDAQKITTKTLTDMTPYTEWIAYVLGLLGEIPADGEAREANIPQYSGAKGLTPYGVDDLLAEGAFVERETIEKARAFLEDRKNLILSGPPGTGKSWLALRLAWIKLGNRGPDSRLMTLQFHQSYSYEEFVRGWRPGKEGFELKDGPFLDFCAAARKDDGRPYVIFIDEINRGDPSRVFGELLSLLEKDKRRPECAVRLSLRKPDEKPFFVPTNLYLIGTMNSADRSLAVVDYALRRRFAFLPLEPAFDSSAFSDYMGDKAKVGMDQDLLTRIVEGMGKLNAEIAKDRNLGPGYRIGHSFFSSIDDDTKLDNEWYEYIVESQILPTLEEYWFDQPAKVSEWRDRLIR